MTTPHLPEHVEKRFDNLFDSHWTPDTAPKGSNRDIKSFIAEETEKAREDERRVIGEECERIRKMGGEFGFCKHCKLHKGDYEHDFGKCAGHDEALTSIQDFIGKRK